MILFDDILLCLYRRNNKYHFLQVRFKMSWVILKCRTIANIFVELKEGRGTPDHSGSYNSPACHPPLLLKFTGF